MKKKARITISKGRGSQPFRFMIQAGNNETIAPSEGYKTATTCRKRANWWKCVLEAFYGIDTVELNDKTKPR